MKNRRVLLVEDEADARHLLAIGLRELGYVCEAAADGKQFLSMLDRTWDALVIDIVLPGASGLELLAGVRTAGMSCLCIVVSSFADKDKAITALNNGADYLLEKPFDVQELHTLLQNLSPATRDLGLEQRIAAYGQLTERERELVLYVLKGLSNEDIARLAGISLQGVKNALGRIYEKLGTVNRRELFSLFIDMS